MRAVAAVVGLLFFAGCSEPELQPPPIYMLAKDQEAYTIDLPQGLDLVKGETVVDYRVDEVRSQGVTLVNIYVGSFSGFEERKDEGVLGSGQPRTFVKTGDQAPTAWLWKTGFTWPAEVEVFLPDDLTAEQAAVGRGIAMSIRPTLRDTKAP